MADRGEVQMADVHPDQRVTENEKQYSEIAPSPGARDVIAQHRDDTHQEVADPDIGGAYELQGRVVRVDRQFEQNFADVGGKDVGSQSDHEPTQLTEPVFGRREEQGE